MMDMVEKVRLAIADVQLWERFNDWTSDCVPGLPVEICRYGRDGEDEIVVVERHSADAANGSALILAVGRARARAAILAMREPILQAALCISGFAGEGLSVEGFPDPTDVYGPLVTMIGLPDAEDDDLRAALQPAIDGGEG